jgi:hypothetical protein
MRNICCAFAILVQVLSFTVTAQTVLQPGDVAVIGYNFKDPDQFSFIFLREVEAGTILRITDCGYDATLSAFRVGEGLLTYTVPAGGLKAGSVVTYPDDAGFVSQGISGFFGLTVDGDQLIFFQGTFVTPAFIYALHVMTESWSEAIVNNNTTALPPGLTDGVTAHSFSKIVNSRLNCTGVAIEPSLFLTQAADETRWERSNADRVSLPDITCDYSLLTLKHSATETLFDFHRKILSDSNYKEIVVYTADGNLYFSTQSLDDALNAIIREKMYIFKVCYPDRLEVVKVIRH